MKKLLLSAVLVLTAFAANAQDFSFGIFGGGNNKSIELSFPSYHQTVSKLGYTAGAFVNVGLTEKFSIQPEGAYTTSFSNFKADNGFNKNEGKFTTIDINLIGKYYVLDKVNIQAGPSVGLTSGKFIKNFNATNATGIEVSNIDISAVVGIGYDVCDHFFVQARTAYGLQNQLKGKIIDANNIEVKTYSFSLTAGYKF